jgi:hypothetical protein
MTRSTSLLCLVVTIAVATPLTAQTTYYVQEQDPKTGKWRNTALHYNTEGDNIKYKGSKTAIELAREAESNRRQELAASGSSVKTRIVTDPNQPGKTTLVQTLEKYKALYAKSPEGAAKLLSQRETLAKQQQELSQERNELRREREDLLLLAGQIATLEGPDEDDLLGGKPGAPNKGDGTDTNGTTETSDEQESADEIRMEYKNRLKKLEKRIEGFNNKAKGYSTGLASLLQGESKLRFAKPYTPVVVRVADRDADRNRPSETTNRQKSDTSREQKDQVAAKSSIRDILINNLWTTTFRKQRFTVKFLPNGIIYCNMVHADHERWEIDGNQLKIHWTLPSQPISLRRQAEFDGNRFKGTWRHNGMPWTLDRVAR